jgi:DNA topoisomerase-6 subunit B
VFLRRRERAKTEFHRRNIFELYIEEVAEACNRLKGGKLRVDRLKAQLQKIAMDRTGGEETDHALGKTGRGPEGLPHSIIVTPEGIEGDLPFLERGASAHPAGSGSEETADALSDGKKDVPVKEKRKATGKAASGKSPKKRIGR